MASLMKMISNFFLFLIISGTFYSKSSFSMSLEEVKKRDKKNTPLLMKLIYKVSVARNKRLRKESLVERRKREELISLLEEKIKKADLELNQHESLGSDNTSFSSDEFDDEHTLAYLKAGASEKWINLARSSYRGDDLTKGELAQLRAFEKGASDRHAELVRLKVDGFKMTIAQRAFLKARGSGKSELYSEIIGLEAEALSGKKKHGFRQWHKEAIAAYKAGATDEEVGLIKKHNAAGRFLRGLTEPEERRFCEMALKDFIYCEFEESDSKVNKSCQTDTGIVYKLKPDPLRLFAEASYRESRLKELDEIKNRKSIFKKSFTVGMQAEYEALKEGVSREYSSIIRSKIDLTTIFTKEDSILKYCAFKNGSNKGIYCKINSRNASECITADGFSYETDRGAINRSRNLYPPKKVPQEEQYLEISSTGNTRVNSVLR